MKIFFALILLAYIPLSFSKSSLTSNCSDYEEVSKSDFILFNKTEFIQLGQCVGRSLIKKNRLKNLAEACSEVIEDNVSPLGIFSVSKIEAIKIGQCLGAVSYVYDRYQGERYNYNSSQTFHCIQGNKAAELLSLEHNNLRTPISLRSAKDVRSVICEIY